MTESDLSKFAIAPVERPVQSDASDFGLEFVEVDALVKASEARKTFNVTGEGTLVAVLDTGLRTTHVDFKDRVVGGLNFTPDNGGDKNNASDGQGHGTNVAGIIAANGNHVGIAPKASVLPIKVLDNGGGGNFEAVLSALDWILAHHHEYPVSAVCMSLGDGGNYTSDEPYLNQAITARIRDLRSGRVPVAVAAGNHYYVHGSRQGMAFPAIIRETISVGAVYDADEGSHAYDDGAAASSSAADRLTPFSQRLHKSVNREVSTDIFAPGAPVTSSGINTDLGESTQHGTSQATPVTVGVILLMQAFHRRVTGELPEVKDVVECLVKGGVTIFDGDDEADNVEHTNAEFTRISAPGALRVMTRRLQLEKLASDSQGQVKTAQRRASRAGSRTQ